MSADALLAFAPVWTSDGVVELPEFLTADGPGEDIGGGGRPLFSFG